jgi:hypothetical protein
MGLIDPELPEVGLPVTTEDPKVRDALAEIVAVINGNLDTVNLASDADVNGTQLLDASVDNTKLTTNSVDTANIVNDAVTADKLRDDVSTDGNRAVTTNHIRDNAVNADKIAEGAVNTSELADNSVTNAKINLTTVTATGSGTPAASTAWAKATNLTVSLSAGTYLIIAALNVLLPDTAGTNYIEFELRDDSTVLSSGKVTEVTGNEYEGGITLTAVRTLSTSGAVDVWLRSPSLFSAASATSRVIALPIG